MQVFAAAVALVFLLLLFLYESFRVALVDHGHAAAGDVARCSSACG